MAVIIMKKSKISSVGSSWVNFRKETFTPEEIAASNLRVARIGELIKARQERENSQKQTKKQS